MKPTNLATAAIIGAYAGLMLVVYVLGGCAPLSPSTVSLRELPDPTPAIISGQSGIQTIIDSATQGKASVPSAGGLWDAILSAADGVKQDLVSISATYQQQKTQYTKANEDMNRQLDASLKANAGLKQQLADAQAKEKAAADKYNNSWFAGKTWRMIGWICGIALGLMIVDALLFVFTSSGTLNPITLVINLIEKIFKRKSA